MDATVLTKEVSRAIGALMRIGIDLSIAACAEAGVSVNQYRALAAVGASQPSSLGDLAQRLNVSAPSATRMCDRLERAALLTRQRSQRDPRSVELELTAAGSELVSRVQVARHQRIAAVVAELGPQAAHDAIRGMQTMLDGFSDLDGSIHIYGWG